MRKDHKHPDGKLRRLGPSHCTDKELMEVEGIGAVKATQIAAVFELTKRIIRHIESE